jgi:uncharacterized protein (DUF885 family)
MPCRILALVILLAVVVSTCNLGTKKLDKIIDGYVKQWKRFYPSRAFSAGDLESAFVFEDVTPEKIAAWADFNRKTGEDLQSLTGKIELDDRIDRDLLERQILAELERWEQDRAFESSPMFYAGQVSQALTHILARDELTPAQKRKAVLIHLSGIEALCAQGKNYLRDGRPHNTLRCLSVLASSAEFFEANLIEISREWPNEGGLESFPEACRRTAASVRSLVAHIRDNVIPDMTLSDSLGEDDYARKLKIYTGTDMNPDELEEIALQEVKEVQALMQAAAKEYWQERYSDEKVPAAFNELMQRVLSDMEANREKDQAGFLEKFVSLIDRAEEFIREKNIATLPPERTLKTALSPPHFAGASVGGVYAAGPFNPSAQTLFYLPSVPDDAPEEVKEGFYRSFNNHFNTMIITHEIYPGHYMQLKLAAANPHIVRSLFADPLYAEGWATLCEVIALDAGWNGYDKLDRLAHLRKRLENATRAYTSVQTHCRGWTKQQVHDFAVEEGLLAPQFATNLWDRIMASPLQLTSYFLGFKMFTEVLKDQKEHLGENFSLQVFCDAVLKAGAVPIDYFPALFHEKGGRAPHPKR